ncbi:MAG TPA: glycine--tRNA ligase subunit beta [Bryobacteraceae bacterium]|nr:glycine--tRNA ligase subunit beta [Bryobacteraceae bacterium]
MPDFLLEIGTEEIPDWMIEPALEDFRGKFQAAFGSFGGSALVTEATPRRLVLFAKDLLNQAADAENVILGPYLTAGEKAAEGFARKQGTTIAQLAMIADAKGQRYVFHQLVKGQAVTQALADGLPAIVAGIHFPKSMYWTGRGGIRFIRPIRWIVAVLNDQIVPFEVAGVKSGNLTCGHRILGSRKPLPVTSANYFDTLEKSFVIVHAEKRKARIQQALGSEVQKDDALLHTLVYLTEYPSAVRGRFDPTYLDLPKEILSTVMRHHQRYFSVSKPDGSLAPEFVAVTNTDGDPDGLIGQGNERVLRARFNDARFFWQVDQQKKLSARVGDLAKVTFQAKLGSYKDKTERIAKLAAQLAAQTDADENVVQIASLLCKCDLTTDMVKEFTELQGIVGGLYAKAQGEGEPVATAIYDHYRPVNMDDGIPRTVEGQVVSIADKLDTLRESFRIGLIPTGTKDPFALRRAAQGVVKILFEARLNLQLMPLIEDVPALVPFMRERIEFYLRDVLGFFYDEVAAVMAPPITTLADLADRAEAIRYVRPTEDFEPLAASFKRIKNILKQAGINSAPPPKADLLVPGPEKDLYEAWLRVGTEARESGSFRDKLAAVASLRPQVDLFFDKILVNDPNPAIRENRLALLYSLLTEFSTIADFSEIVTKGLNA